MATLSGRTFAETVFSDSWLLYLSGYGINQFPDEWFYRTITQAYDGCEEAEKAALICYLIKQKGNNPTSQRQLVSKKYEPLFERVLEPCFLQKLSVFTAREILSEYVVFQNKRVSDYNERQKLSAEIAGVLATQIPTGELDASGRGSAKEAKLPTENDNSVIDVTSEGQPIDFSQGIKVAHSVENNTYASYYDENWKLGNRYRDKLKLSDAEVSSLNQFWDPSNSFLAVEFCCIAVIKLYLLCLDHTLLQFAVNGNDFYKELKRFTTQNQSLRGEYCSVQTFKEQMETYVHLTFFRRAENAVREAYQHKRKINTVFTFYNLSAGFEHKFGDVWNSILNADKQSIQPADSSAEVQLNRMNVTRWKLFFDEIAASVTNENVQQKILRIDELAEQNKGNPAVENIYYEASKLFAKQDKIASVSFYLKYIYADLQSGKIDNKQLGKTIQKSLFANEEQLHDFEMIIDNLVRDRNVQTAISKVPAIYGKKRKKIELDLSSLEQVKAQHQNTVDKLNQWLQEEEGGHAELSETVRLNIAEQAVEKPIPPAEVFTVTVLLSDQQKDLLLLFSKNNFQLEEEILSSYAKSKSLFKNQLVESINDCCYEELDDLMIEETSGGYSVNEFYYNKIVNLC